MNELIKWTYQQGLSYDLYSWINTAGGIVAFLYCLFHGKKFGIKIWKMAIILVVVFFWQIGIQSVIWPVLQYVRDTHFLGINTATNSIVRTFIFVPIIALPLAKIFKYKFGHICDAIVMLPLLKSAIAQIACIFPGCCRGYEFFLGIYNIKTQSYHFPTPLLETLLTLIIFAYLVSRTINKKFVSDGTLYPLMMVLYGMMRFVCEMLRDNEKIFLGINAIGLHAIFICLVGLIALHLIKKKRAKEAALLLAVEAMADTVKEVEHTENETATSDTKPSAAHIEQNASKKNKKRKNQNKRKTKIKKKKKKKKKKKQT